MGITGYKVFYKGLINRHGQTFEVGKSYAVQGNVVWGNSGNGFHFCENLEDCFRYIDTFNFEIEVAEVIGFGEIIEVSDDYYGYYDMHVSKGITITKVLSREEIIAIMLEKDADKKLRFLRDYRLIEEESSLFDIKQLKKQVPHFRY